MNKFIDMHCHIIPGVDDGASNIEESIEMLKTAYKEGIRYIVATPHFHPKRGEAELSELKQQLVLLRQEAEKLDEKIMIFVGHEIYYTHDVVELLKDKRILTINGRQYVLIEFSPSVEVDYLKRGIQQLQMSGYIVILAHVERYACLREDDFLLEYLGNTGVLFQVNAGSIVGDKGRSVKKFVKRLLKEEKVFCVGTDAHDVKVRPPVMSKAAAYVEKKYGEEYARRIFFSNMAMMLKKKQ